MGRVLISEPHADVAALLELVVRRLGHEPVAHGGGAPAHAGLDAAVIEPGDAAGREAAEALSAHGVPLLFTSIYPPSHELMALEPVAWLVKPFPLSSLGRVIEAATIAGGCARRSSCSR
jgi:hypothetical protein